MPLTELKRRRWTGINRHAVREYRSEDGRTFILDRTLDGVPPFFHLTERGDQPHPKPILIDGQEYWGSGWNWAQATAAAEHVIAPARKRGAR